MPKTILVIDDDQIIVETLKEGLESLDYKVIAAYDGLQGVLQAHQGKPDLIILDFQMPAGGGSGVYERLRAATDTCQTPIVFLTGSTVQQVKEKIRSSPNTYFLKKPASFEQINTVIAKILGSAPAPIPGRTPTDPSRPASQTASQPPSPVKTPPLPGTAAAGRPAVGGKIAAGVHESDVRAAPADAEASGLVRHEMLLRWLENGRVGLMNSIGVPYPEIGVGSSLSAPVYEVRCEYLAPCRVGDTLRIRTWLAWLGSASFCFQHEVFLGQPPERLAARAFSRHAVVDNAWKPTRLPKDVKAVLQKNLREG
jgi:YbgC/YbaW family acyl-CoA thioester hydrolase